MSHDSDVKTIQEVEQTYTETLNATNQKTVYLKKLLVAIDSSQSFDKEDAHAVQQELSKQNNQEITKYRQLAMERLKVLKEFDEVLHFKESHPDLNLFFVSKQQEIMKVLAKSGR
jgi:phosphoglucomutase